MKRAAVLLSCLGAAACGEDRPPRALPGELALSELASSNAGGGRGAARDEHGDYDDWVELANLTDRALDLAGLMVSDNPDNPGRYVLPEDPPLVLPPGGFLLLFPDGETHQGPAHLPFSLDKDGEALVVSTSTGAVLGRTVFPRLAAGQSWALDGQGYRICETPTPGAANLCQDRTPPPKQSYAPYAWPSPWPEPEDAPLVFSELDPLGQTGTSSVPWVELWNRGASALDLTSFDLRLVVLAPPEPIPTAAAGQRLLLTGSLAPGERRQLALPALPPDSGVLLIFGPGGQRLSVLAYESPAAGAVLARPADGRAFFAACALDSATPGAPNGPCLPAPSRSAAPPMLRSLGSLADLEAMAGPLEETTSDAQSVKFLVDRDAGGAIYFVDSARWRLHFDWFWEVVRGERPFDLCVPAERARHLTEWSLFSQQNYFVVEGRRFYLGTLIHYRDSDLYTVEYAAGDHISAAQVEESFFAVARASFAPEALHFRPTTSRLEGVALEVEGRLPIVPAAAPFAGTRLQILNPGLGYGVLTFVPAGEEEDVALGYQTIPVFARIPPELPPVNGTITEEFQTPLSHLNVLAQNRGTPNLALKDARNDPRVAPFLGKLVRLRTTPSGFEIHTTTATEAEAFWQAQIGSRPPVVPPLDLSLADIVSLDGLGLADTARIGAKAAQLAELSSLDWPRFAGPGAVACLQSGFEAQLPVPRPAFALPFAFYRAHVERNGIQADIEALLDDPALARDPIARRQALARIRASIEAAPVDPVLLRDLTVLLDRHFGNKRVRFRSSTNVEDLAGFNGAGLYESHSAQLGSEVRPIEEALRKVWSSLWTQRGYEERALFGVDQRRVAMGVLIHEGFPAEEANGVAITRNVVAPDSHGFYINAQQGELSVVLPETGDLPEQLLYKLYTPPDIVVLGRSTATLGAPVLSNQETHRLSCALTAIHNRLRALYGGQIPADKFAADVEWKLVGPERALVIKQARPWTPPAAAEPGTCP